jgi:PPM family protein phosphatase
MDLMTIGEFAARTRLSPKALRRYDRLGLLPPERPRGRGGAPRYARRAPSEFASGSG